MSETFKIRKNKSQKEIHLNHQHRRRSPLLATQQIPKTKATAHTHFHKVMQLEPLIKSKGSIHNQGEKTLEMKLDYTQPIPLKSSSLNKHEAKPEMLHLQPIDPKGPLKYDLVEKENRLGNANQIKCPIISKIYSTYIKPEKYDNKVSLTQMTEGLQQLRAEKDLESEGTKKSIVDSKRTKMTLLKTSSRSKLAKIFGTKQVSQQRHNVYEVEIETEPDLSSMKTFRKGILHKIFNQARNAMVVDPTPKDSPCMEDKDDEARKQQDLSSPVMKKETNMNWGNCSTIREQEESCSSFISKDAFEELICKKQRFESVPFLEEKTQPDRRMKNETDRIKKKFPQNFFK